MRSVCVCCSDVGAKAVETWSGYRCGLVRLGRAGGRCACRDVPPSSSGHLRGLDSLAESGVDTDIHACASIST